MYFISLYIYIYVYPWISCHLKYQSISPKMISYITHSTSKVPPGSRLSDPVAHAGGFFCWTEIWKQKATKFPTHFKYHFNWQKSYENMGMDQYLLIPFLVGWTPIYQLFWCSPGVLLVLTHCHIWNGGDFTWFHQASQVNQPWCSGASFGSIFNGMNPLQTWEREENSW